MKEKNTDERVGENLLIRLAQEGNSEAFSALLLQNEAFLKSLISHKSLSKFFKKHQLEFALYKDDLLQIARIEFIEAIKTFDFTKGSGLRTYAHRKVFNSVRDFCKKWIFTVTAFISEIETIRFALQDDLSGILEIRSESTVWKHLEDGCKKLTPIEENVFLLHLHLNMKGYEIAKRLNVSPARISYVLSSAKMKLKNYFKQVGY